MWRIIWSNGSESEEVASETERCMRSRVAFEETEISDEDHTTDGKQHRGGFAFVLAGAMANRYKKEHSEESLCHKE
jgi:hypothetical protein